MTNTEKVIEKIDFLIQKLRKARDQYLAENVNFLEPNSFEKLRELEAPYSKALGKLSRTRRVLIEPVMEELSDYGELYSFEIFKAFCKTGGFIDYDGYGKYSDGEKMSNISIFPSDIRHKHHRKDFSHVIWFNR